MNDVNYEYRRILNSLFACGESVETRNSKCLRIVCECVTFLHTPLVSVRKTAWLNALREWEWFMSGSHNINDLHPAVRSWWEPWADKDGWIPYNYSSQFRHYRNVPGGRPVDQIQVLVDGVKNHPFSRRNVITTWNTADMLRPENPITNCHGTVIQAFVSPKSNKLSLVTYQRSIDSVCGLPHNWIQYWAFLLWLAHRGGRSVGELKWIGGDVHLYEAHKDLARRMIVVQTPQEPPELIYTPSGDDFKADDFKLEGEYAPVIVERAEMIV